jgi:hypothetical protein
MKKDAQLARLSSGSTEKLPTQLIFFKEKLNDRYFSKVKLVTYYSQIPLNPNKEKDLKKEIN